MSNTFKDTRKYKSTIKKYKFTKAGKLIIYKIKKSFAKFQKKSINQLINNQLDE